MAGRGWPGCGPRGTGDAAGSARHSVRRFPRLVKQDAAASRNRRSPRCHGGAGNRDAMRGRTRGDRWRYPPAGGRRQGLRSRCAVRHWPREAGSSRPRGAPAPACRAPLPVSAGRHARPRSPACGGGMRRAVASPPGPRGSPAASAVPAFRGPARGLPRSQSPAPLRPAGRAAFRGQPGGACRRPPTTRARCPRRWRVPRPPHHPRPSGTGAPRRRRRRMLPARPRPRRSRTTASSDARRAPAGQADVTAPGRTATPAACGPRRARGQALAHRRPASPSGRHRRRTSGPCHRSGNHR